ncbi:MULTISPECIES: glycosyltransferase family 4 protein [Hyphomicrobiales]|jgi:glycosyltransferase involved in cell wall biosynthesis|uniref:Glycosyltransferase family 4 protein n=1 Tax=Bosea massiliensis TaxID=151419 RepID=A0ABW0P0E8_9HYPH|nr:glycosyltransferase family 4 protein [Methylobacterium sp. CCH7-A2]
MRILHLLNHTTKSNGHVHAAVDLACEQSRLGHAVAIASGGGDFDALLASNGVETFRIDHHRKPATLLKSGWALRRLLRGWRADLVHAHMMTSAVLAWPVCKLAAVPLVTTVHNAFEKSAILMRVGTRVIAVSAAVGASMQQRGIPSAKLRVVLNGTIGSARLAERETQPAALGSPSILFVGGLHPRKGLPDLFAAFEQVHRRHPHAHLYIVGEGPYSETYRDIVAGLFCRDAVHFEGSQWDPFPWMLGADIFVLPSHADPAPLVLSEAREAGCAVVATSVDGIPELLEKGEAGVLVPARDPDALAVALCQLIDEPGAIRDWRARSQRRIDHLRISRVARETFGVYEDAIRQSGRLAGPGVSHSNRTA